MASINVGAVGASLTLDSREWIKACNEAAGAIREVGKSSAQGLADLTKATQSGFAQATAAMASFSREIKDGAQTVSGAIGGLKDSVEQSTQAIAKSVSEMHIAHAFQQAGKVIMDFSSLVVGELKKAGGAFVEFSALMRNANVMAKLSEQDLGALSKTVRDLGPSMGSTKGPRDLSESLYAISSSGYKAKDAMEVLTTSMQAAEAGKISTGLWADALGQTLNAYGLKASDAMRVTDQLFQAVHQGGATLTAQSMAANIGDMAPVAHAAGVSLQELTGAYALMTTKGQTASENATQLRSLIHHLVAPTGEAKKIIQAYGIEAGETAIRTKGLLNVLKDLYAKTGGNKEVLRKVLDIRGEQAAVKLVGDDKGAQAEEWVNNQREAGGAMKAALEQQKKEMQHVLGEIKAAWEAFQVAVFQGFEPVAKPAIEKLRDWMVALVKMPDATKAAIGGLAALTAGFTAVLGGALLLAPQLLAIATFIGESGGLAGALLAIKGGFAAFAGSVASVVGPIALVVAAVAGLAYAWQHDLGGIQEHTREFMAEVQDLHAWTAALEGAKQIWAAVRVDLSEGLATLQAEWAKVWPDIREAVVEFWQVCQPLLRVAAGFLRDFLPDVVKFFREKWEAEWQVIKGIVSVAWTGIKFVFESVAIGLKGLVDTVQAMAAGQWQRAWETFKATVVAELTLAYEAFKEVLAKMLATIVGAASAFYSAGGKLVEAFAAGIRGRSGEVAQAVAEMEQIAQRGLSNDLSGWDMKNNAGDLMRSAGRGVQTTRAESEARSEAAGAGLTAALNDLTSMMRARQPIGGGTDGYKEPPPMIDTHHHRARAATHRMTPAEMISYIRQNTRDLGANLGGLDRETLDATVKYVKNAVAAGIRLQITSGRRHGGGRSHHDHGQAVDIQFADRPNIDNDMVGSGLLMRLAAGTGYRTGINEYRTDARAWTHGTGPHMHLTTGLQQVGPGLPGAFAVSGHRSNNPFQEQKKDLQEIQKILELIHGGKSRSTWDKQRDDLKKTYDEAISNATALGVKQEDINRLKARYRGQVEEVNRLESVEANKVLQDVTIKRLEAEGHLGEAARMRIDQNYQHEYDALEKLKVHHKDLLPVIESAQAALSQSRQREHGQLDLSKTLGQVDVIGTQRNFAEQGWDTQIVARLTTQFGQFRRQIQEAMADIAAYSAAPSEANKKRFEDSVQLLQKIRGLADAEENRKIRAVEFDRAMGNITKQEELARRAEILNKSIQGEEQRKQMILGLADAYKQELQLRLQLQGDYNLQTLEQMRNTLLKFKELTASQQAELAAVQQAIMEQRLAEQQQWVQTIQQAESAFSTFLQNVFSGQQSFGQSFSQFWKSIANLIIQELVKMIVKALALQRIMQGIFSFFGGIFGGFGGLAGVIGGGGGGAAGAAAALFHDGGLVGPNGPVQTFHRGGLVQSYHTGGLVNLRGNEVLAKLEVGEYVLNRQQVAAARSGGRPAQVVQLGGIHFGGVTVNDRSDADYLAREMVRRFGEHLDAYQLGAA